MSELLLHESLRNSKEDDEVRNIARVLTLTVLPRLDDVRKIGVLEFLHESCLIKKDNRIIDLAGVMLAKADLSPINLMGDDLSGALLAESKLDYAYLNEANLEGAILNSASLRYADLRKANLEGADLLGAKLYGANFSFTNLTGASVTDEQLKETKSLKGATMSGGSILP